MKRNGKIISITLMTAMVTLLFAGCAGKSTTETTSPSATAPAKIRVAIVQPLSHSSLDQIRETIVSELEASDVEFEITTLNANGDTSSLSTILSNEKSKGVDIVVPIATSTAQSAKVVFDGEKTPIIFAAVSDPVAAGLTGDDSKNITGVSNSIPAAEIVKLISNFQPDFKKIGFLYTSSEANSVSTINKAKAYCDANGIAYEESSIAALSDLQSAVNSLLSKGVDVLYTGNDNSIASAMTTYTDAAYSKGVPVYCGADSMVADGGFATIGVNYVQLGKQVADMVVKIAKGSEPSEIPYETLSEYAKFINLQAADKLSFELTDKMLEGYKVLVEQDGTSHFGK
ncbi:ABC transporter substrate-binding protein [Youngiibacter multivorans]|uniref:ABC transport system substrate-binding protein n=1 Tax=Youngiibacter multivorans TaxID=937251 RepID=A0ABS4G105_9CLOT|nr:ABC transporter substrate-binding protein [Youngiibacter multivorans]MBP1918228.1 putative ABC transport system substrate-binding protein [Youngiibacter multivorans]